MKKSRAFYINELCNEEKLKKLEDLHEEYRYYVQLGIDTMLERHVLTFNYMNYADTQAFFPKPKADGVKILNSNFADLARRHAIDTVSAWASAVYQRKLKSYIYLLFKNDQISEKTKIQLCNIGKYLIIEPSKTITQGAIDLYWSLLLDEKLCGKPPQVSKRFPMRLDVRVAKLKMATNAKATDVWLSISTLEPRKRIDIPLKSNPYIKDVSEVAGGLLLCKDKKGRCKIQAVERKEYQIPKVSGAKEIGIDVGLNVIAAMSDGRLYGEDFKPTFDYLHNNILSIRANRQRQNLRENSPRLMALEYKLSEMMKTVMGEISNDIIKEYPDTVFVLEDLNLNGSRGQKRFVYRTLYRIMCQKAVVKTCNPAYTSQTCPDCGYVSNKNRKGIKFVCRCCGAVRHADVVGAINLLRRSEDKEIDSVDHYKEIESILRTRFRHRRCSTRASDCIDVFPDTSELPSLSQGLTTGVLS